MNNRTAHMIAADVQINESIARNAIYEQCGQKPNIVKLLGEGYDNVVFLVDNHLIFRFPRRARSVDLLLREIYLLPKIEKHLSIKIPQPIFWGEGGESFEYPFYGYEYLPGVSGCQVTLSVAEYRRAAYLFGGFLKQLHALDTSLVSHAPPFDRTDFPKLLALLQSRLATVRYSYDLRKYDDKIEDMCVWV